MRWVILVALQLAAFTFAGPYDRWTDALKVRKLQVAAPTIDDKEVAELIVYLDMAGVKVELLLDKRLALAPSAYTNHLTALPNVKVRVLRGQRYRFIVIPGQGAYTFDGTKRLANAYVAQFARLWARAKPYVYVPRPPRGYAIYLEDPIDQIMRRAQETIPSEPPGWRKP